MRILHNSTLCAGLCVAIAPVTGFSQPVQEAGEQQVIEEIVVTGSYIGRPTQADSLVHIRHPGDVPLAQVAVEGGGVIEHAVAGAGRGIITGQALPTENERDSSHDSSTRDRERETTPVERRERSGAEQQNTESM